MEEAPLLDSTAMNVLVLAPYRFDTAPGQRFRIEQWMPKLQALGARFHFAPFMSEELSAILYQRGHALKKVRAMIGDLVRRVVQAVRSRRFDVVFLHREAALIGPPLIERLIAALSVPIVYEFDDAVYVPYVSPANRYMSLLKFPAQKTDRLCRLAAHVIVGNDVLRDYAIARNANVTIVPTTIDTDKYTQSCAYEPDGELVIGWSGSYSSVQYLDALKPALSRLRRTHRFSVEVIGATSFTMDDVEVRSRAWHSASEVEDLKRIHVGVMPLPDEDWARGKCALKALQYMALGIPTVVSPVGANCEVIRHDVDGLYAATTDEWVARLAALLDDAALRRRLGEAGRRRVVEKYSAAVHAPRVHAVLESVARSRARRAASVA
jgi:glycosyltransferase involved in cell wall biosynthesis